MRGKLHNWIDVTKTAHQPREQKLFYTRVSLHQRGTEESVLELGDSLMVPGYYSEYSKHSDDLDPPLVPRDLYCADVGMGSSSETDGVFHNKGRQLDGMRDTDRYQTDQQ